MQSYISLRREQQQRRVSIYLNPEVSGFRPPITIFEPQSLCSLPSIEEMASRHNQEYVLDCHPFLQRLQREPVNQQHIWLLLMNIGEAIVPDVTRRLANIISRIDDDRIRCILAHQLNDELGNGNINHIHRPLFKQMMTVIDPWRVESFSEDMVMPGKEMSARLEEIFLDSNPYMGVGASIMMEICANQFYLWLGKELRKTTVDISAIPWATLHEELDVVHAEESLILARLVDESAEGVIAARQAIEKFSIVTWGFFNELYRLCFH
jgi:pyrroloquinoline quinone (PQQ) biosynthesis protein C